MDEWLSKDGLIPYFSTVVQSSVTLLRKPHPAIYYYAMHDLRAEAENCCYIGDNLNRDIVGAKAVNFGMTVAVEYPDGKPLKITDENRPDAKISHYLQLLDLFPARGQVNTDQIIRP